MPTVDLEPLGAQIATLRDSVAAIPAPDLWALDERISSLPTVDLEPLGAQIAALQDQVAAQPVTDLGPVLQQLDGLRTAITTALTDGLASLPAPPDDAEVRDDLSRLNAQLDGLRTALADRFDAIPAPDLTPLATEIATLAERVGAIQPPDLGPVEQRLAQLDQQVAALPSADALDPRAVAIDRGDPRGRPHRRGATSITDAAASVRQEVADLPDPATAAEAAITPLRTDLEGLVARNHRRPPRPRARHRGPRRAHPAGRSGRRTPHRSHRGAARRLAEQRASVSQTVAELSRTLGGQVQQVESQLVQLVTRTAALDDVQQGLARTREAVAALGDAGRPDR